MTGHGGDGRQRLHHQPDHFLIVPLQPQVPFPQTQHVGAQFVLYLLAVVPRVNLNPGHQVFPVQDAMALLNVQELDGEGIVGVFGLFEREQQRCGLLLLDPPIDGLRSPAQFRNPHLAQGAEHVQVGIFLLIIVAGRRAIQDHAHQVVPVGLAQPLHQLFQ